MESLEHIVFDFDVSAVKMDNYTNTYICLEEDMFTYNIEPIICNGVEIIGGKNIITKGIGTVSWYWTDEYGQQHTNILNNVQ